MSREFVWALKTIRRINNAARWRVRAEEDAQIEQSADLRGWLSERKNQEAYDRISQSWQVLDDHEFAPEMLVLRKIALQRSRGNSGPIWKTRNAIGWATLAAILFVAVLIGLRGALFPEKPVAYATNFQGKRTVALEDGSRISLDASTAASVLRFSRAARELSLDKGRARFDVVRDKARPFTVKAGVETIIATGTSFDVERLMSKVRVTVTQGHVIVRVGASGSSDPQPSIRLSPGQEMTATQAGDISIANVDIRTVNAWEQGKIILNDEPLDESVERFNRYMGTPVLVDPAISKMRVSGIFNADHIDAFIGALTNYFSVQSTLSSNGQILLEKRT